MAVAKTVIKLSHLKSRAIAKLVSPSGKSMTLGTNSTNWFSRLLSGVKSIVGFVTQKILKFLRSIDFKKIWRWIVNAFQIIWNFNWQATDKELNERIKGAWRAVETRMFGVLGKALGYLICGVGPGAVIATFNMPLATLVLHKVGEEFVQEMLGDLQAFLQLTAQAAMQWLLLKGYMMIRRIIKGSTGVMNKAWQVLLGVPAGTIKEWGEKEGETWSFSKQAQEKREALGERLAENLEEFTDEFSDACIEAGFIVAGGMDEFFGLDGLTKGFTDLFGQHREVKFTPNKNVPDETFTVVGREQFVQQQISSIVHQRAIIDNREIGLNLPSQGDWDVIPVTENNGIEVMFEFLNYEQPPYWTKERRKSIVRSRLVVPNVDRTRLTWESIKLAFGTKKVFDKGNKRCEANLTNGRKLVIYTDTDTEGEMMLEKLASFTNERLVYPIDVRSHRGTEKRVGYNLQVIRKPQYLAAMTVTNWHKLTKYEQQKAVTQKDRKNQVTRFKMHYSQKPTWFDEKLRDAIALTVN